MAKKYKVSRKKVPRKKMAKKKVPKFKIMGDNGDVDRFALFEMALRKLTKADCVELLISTARGNEIVCRDLQLALKIDSPVSLLLTDISSAIDRATEIDENRINYNFSYDSGSYDFIRSGFVRLIALGKLVEVKSLAVELMKQGSLQVECSDEGMMTDEIEDCLKPVIRAVKSVDKTGAKSWANEMIAADRVGFICDDQLRKLAAK